MVAQIISTLRYQLTMFNRYYISRDLQVFISDASLSKKCETLRWIPDRPGFALIPDPGDNRMRRYAVPDRRRTVKARRWDSVDFAATLPSANSQHTPGSHGS